MDYLIRFSQMHETFRQPEINALADMHDLKFKWLSYADNSPFAIIRFVSTADAEAVAKKLIARSILAFAIHELWGEGADYTSLHQDVRSRTEQLWEQHRHVSFRFELDSFQGSRSSSEQRDIIEDFRYMAFEGRIVMKSPSCRFSVFEDYDLNAQNPKRLFLGKLIAESGRKAIARYNLKKRKYIATTSMDAELSLVTANMALAGPGKLAYDPFMGTGSFPLACAHFGSVVWGSDMDGRSIRGKKGCNVVANFEQYGTSSFYLGGFAADLTNTPIRLRRCLDSIICDPPYGVREGLKVLGSTRVALHQEVFLSDGRPAHLQDGYVPPRKPYSFLRMIDDILDFSSSMLVDGGRLAMWMPVAGAIEDENNIDASAETAEEELTSEYIIPKHPALSLVSTCTQNFNKWSRRLLTYRRVSDDDIDHAALAAYRLQRLELHSHPVNTKSTADELNDFRRKYFQGFRESV